MVFDLTASSNSRKLMILNPDYPQDVVKTVTPGASDTAVFQVVIAEKGRPEKYTYQWYANGEKVEGAQSDTYERDLTKDKGVYTVWCEVTNKAGTVRTREAKLTVKKVPVLNGSYPGDVTVTVGTDATFEVKIDDTGYPDAYTYQWYLNGTAVNGATKASFTHYRSLKGSDEVYCEVTNETGTVKSRVAKFTANRLYLYNYGDQCSGVSGGWVAAWSGSNSASNYIKGITHESNRIWIHGKANEYVGGAGTNRKLDLSKHTKVTAIVASSAGYMRVASTISGFNNGTLASAYIPSTEQKEISIDISKISAGHIVFDALANDDQAFSTWVYSVWLG